jgi:predicted RNA binding protein YcfA (HicA-like mRNA interferase family)
VAKSFARNVKQVLKEHGCYFERQGKGDHEIWRSPITEKYFTVDNGITSRHTANGIMKQAGIDHHF